MNTIDNLREELISVGAISHSTKADDKSIEITDVQMFQQKIEKAANGDSLWRHIVEDFDHTGALAPDKAIGEQICWIISEKK